MIPCNDACEADQREAELLSLDTIKDKYNKGRGSSSDCPRAGAMMLQTYDGLKRQVTTACNTWSCVGCRDRNKMRFRNIVASGCSTLGRCSFITITYKAGSKRLERAGCVQRDWQALTRRLKKQSPWVSQLEYLKVTEKTKKGTPHHHLIMGTIPLEKKINCWRRNDFQVGVFRERMGVCGCLSHEIARSWASVTGGESFIVFGVAVTSARGAGSYLGKYMAKVMPEGNGRRFSKSNGWPSEKRRRLIPGKGWVRVQWSPGPSPEDLERSWDDIPRSGTKRQKEESRRNAVKRFIKLGEDNVHTT